jgi:hypothetical protein
MNKTSFNYITKCKIIFCVLAINHHGRTEPLRGIIL